MSDASPPAPSRDGTAPERSALRIQGLSKTFPGQRALIDVNFELAPGEVHALVGQNGSGKSTLIKILAGYHDPDPGVTVEVAGQRLPLGDAQATLAAGLRFVHQDLALVPTLDTLDNLALGRGYARSRGGTISWRREASAARKLLRELGYEFDLRRPVAALGAAERTGIAIARALQDWEGRAHVLFLDEPTAALPAGEVKRLFDVIRAVSERGVAVAYVSHHLTEVFELCDRVTVLRDGRVVATRPVAELDEPALIELTVGRAIQRLDHRDNEITRRDDVVLRIRGLSGRVLDGIDLDVHRREVVGIAGVTGSGREELAPLLFGVTRREGEVVLDGRQVVSGHPTDSLACGMALVPSNRAAQGIIGDMTLRENMTLGALDAFTSRRGLRHRAEREGVSHWLERLEVSPARPEIPISKLSGGNQQKIVLGRALRRNPRVLLLDEPTQGVDVGAKAAIHKIIDEVSESGTSVVVASTETEELVRLCHRIIVLVHGRILAVCNASEISPDELTNMALGVAPALTS